MASAARRFASSLRLALLTTCLVACASAAPSPRERGLADLRVQLGQPVPVGQVVGDRLVHTASGLTLARLPPGTWNTSDASGVPALFEGAPGVAMIFDSFEISLVRVRDGELERIGLPTPEYPTPLAIKAAEHSISDGPAQPELVELELEVPARGVSATFSAAALIVNSAPGDELFASQSYGPAGPVCIGEFEASLARATLPDGGVLFYFKRSAVFRVANEACTDEIRAQGLDHTFQDGSERHEESEQVWLHFPADGRAPRVIESETVFGDDFDTTTINRRVIDIPGGYLAFEQTDSSSRGGSNRAWTWTLVTDDGALHDLAAGS